MVESQNRRAAGMEEGSTTELHADRFKIWPVALACGFPLLLIALWSLPFIVPFVGAPILIGLWACAAVLALVMAVFAVKNHRWRQASSLLVLPLVSLVAMLNAGSVWSITIETGERIHFEVLRRSYLQELSMLPATGEPRFAMWRWGGFGVGHAVVYDESDEIMLSEQSSGWKVRVANNEVGMCGAWGTPMGDHFYLVRTGC
jgi:hypothetical protein